MSFLRQFVACLLLAALSGAGVVAAGPELTGPLTPDRLKAAAEAAGFRVNAVSADIPIAVRSNLPYTSLDYEDSLLENLRQKHQLSKVIAGAPDEFTAQLLLKDWVFRHIPGGTPRHNPRTALEILDLAAKGEKFWCTYYAITYQQAALALGWQARHIGVDRSHGPEGMGSTHHGVVEIWSNQFRKWVVIDAQSNLHFEKAGVPLSAWEIRAEWIYKREAGVDHIVGAPPAAMKKNPAMVWTVPDADEIATYFWLYIEDHDDFARKPSRKIFPQDFSNAREIWYQNDDETKRGVMHSGYVKDLFVPTDRIGDAYWTVGVVEASLAGASPGTLQLSLDTYCPNLSAYEVSWDGETWEKVTDEKSVVWRLAAGWNSLRLRTVGRGGVLGPETAVALYLER